MARSCFRAVAFTLAVTGLSLSTGPLEHPHSTAADHAGESNPGGHKAEASESNPGGRKAEASESNPGGRKAEASVS